MEVGPAPAWGHELSLPWESCAGNPILLPGPGVKHPGPSLASFSLAELLNKRVWGNISVCSQASEELSLLLKAIFWLSYCRESHINTEPRKGQPQTQQLLKPNGFGAEFLVQAGCSHPEARSQLSSQPCRHQHCSVQGKALQGNQMLTSSY